MITTLPTDTQKITAAQAREIKDKFGYCGAEGATVGSVAYTLDWNGFSADDIADLRALVAR